MTEPRCRPTQQRVEQLLRESFTTRADAYGRTDQIVALFESFLVEAFNREESGPRFIQRTWPNWLRARVSSLLWRLGGSAGPSPASSLHDAELVAGYARSVIADLEAVRTPELLAGDSGS